jgi:hypothetical protein
MIMQKAHVKKCGRKIDLEYLLSEYGPDTSTKDFLPNRHLAIVIGAKGLKKQLFIWKRG